jgi:hypothetical protein
MGSLTRVLQLAVVAALSCKPPSRGAVQATTAGVSDAGGTALGRILPDSAGPFIALGSWQTGDGFFRRTYALADKRVEVTVANLGGPANAYHSWVANSRGYPQVALSISPEEANGFFTCADEGETVCDIHIQFRSGFHVEGMGNGRVSKSDLVGLLAKLNLAALADASILPM